MKLATFIVAVILLVVTVNASRGKTPIKCVKSGCSGTLCVKEGEEVTSTCEWKDEYQCYQAATCKQQSSGRCGWVQDSRLKKCLKDKASSKPSDGSGKPSNGSGKPSNGSGRPSNRVGRPSNGSGRPSNRVGRPSSGFRRIKTKW